MLRRNIGVIGRVILGRERIFGPSETLDQPGILPGLEPLRTHGITMFQIMGDARDSRPLISAAYPQPDHHSADGQFVIFIQKKSGTVIQIFSKDLNFWKLHPHYSRTIWVRFFIEEKLLNSSRRFNMNY